MTKKPKRVMTKASKAGCRSAGGLRTKLGEGFLAHLNRSAIGIVTSSCGRGIDRAAYHPLHFLIRKEQIVVDDAPACIGSIDHAHPEPLDGGLLGSADPRHPAGGSRPDSANARSFVEAMTVILPASGPIGVIADENTSMSISGAANTTAPILPVTVSPSRASADAGFRAQHRSQTPRWAMASAGIRSNRCRDFGRRKWQGLINRGNQRSHRAPPLRQNACAYTVNDAKRLFAV